MDSAVSVIKGVCVVFTVLIADIQFPDLSEGKTSCRGHVKCALCTDVSMTKKCISPLCGFVPYHIEP